MIRPALGSLASFAVLFLGSGIAQVLPWGVPSAESLRAASPETVAAFGTDQVATHPVGAFTTPAFDELAGQVAILMTDETVAWIAAQPIAYYDPGAYMGKEVLTQALVAILLTAILTLTRELDLPGRLGIVGLAGLAAAAATYGQLINWWGLTWAYGLGASVNLVATWLVAAAIVGRFIVVPTERDA